MVRKQVDIRSGTIDCAKLKVGSAEGPQERPEIHSGSGDPSHSAPKGTLYIKIDASTTTTRLWINTDGGTTWTYFTTAA